MNDFYNPTLELSSSFVLESGTCSTKWARESNHKSKNKLLRNVRMINNVACVDILSKKKVYPTLAFPRKKLTMATEDEC